MSDALTRLDDFYSAPVPPSMQSIRVQFGGQLRGALVAATLSVGLISTSPPPSSSPASTQPPSSAARYGHPLTSPAALTKESTQTKIEGFSSALRDAIELADIMVAEGEGDPLDFQTLVYAVQALTPLIMIVEAPPALILPLQNGGISAEWHTAGMNIELRFRKPYEVYAVLEDARGAVSTYHGRDPHLVHARAALRELGIRSVS